jgi:hypothetical protein
MSPSNNRRGRERTKVLEQRSWELRARGMTTRAIAAELGIDQSYVVRLLRKTEARVLAEAEEICRGVKILQSEQIEHLYGEVMAAWEGSKKFPKLVRKRKLPDGTVEKVVEVRTSVGDVKFISEARALLESHRRLWGLGAEAEGGGEFDVETLRVALAAIREQRATGGGTPVGDP